MFHHLFGVAYSVIFTEELHVLGLGKSGLGYYTHYTLYALFQLQNIANFSGGYSELALVSTKTPSENNACIQKSVYGVGAST